MLARVRLEGEYGGQGHINVLHFHLADATTAQYGLLGELVDGFWCDSIRGNVDNNMKWFNAHVEDLGGDESPYDQAITRSGFLGPSNVFCPFIAAVFLFHTEVGGRTGRGRSYQGGFGHGAEFNGGLWSTSTFIRIENVCGALTDYWATTGTQRHLVNFWTLQVCNREETVSGFEVDEIVGRAKVGTRNSRKIGRGL